VERFWVLCKRDVLFFFCILIHCEFLVYIILLWLIFVCYCLFPAALETNIGIIYIIFVYSEVNIMRVRGAVLNICWFSRLRVSRVNF
jgi:hypothetical protein